MPFTPIQYAIVAFAASAVLGAIMRFRRGDMRRGPAALWVAVWTAVAVFVTWPGLSQRVALAFGVGRGVDLIVYLSIVALLFMQYRTWSRQERIDRAITAISREVALKGLADDVKGDPSNPSGGRNS